MSDPTASERKAATTSLGQLFGEVTKDFSTLMRQELELAKAEVTESAKKAGKGAGMFAGAGYAGHFVVLFLSIAAWWALGNVIDNGWSALVVAAVWALIAAVLFSRGRAELKKVRGIPRTVESLRKIPPTLKPNAARIPEENR